MIRFEPGVIADALLSIQAGIWTWDSDWRDRLRGHFADGRIYDLRDAIADEDWHLLMSQLEQALIDHKVFETSVRLKRPDEDAGKLRMIGALSLRSSASPVGVTGLCWHVSSQQITDARPQWAPLAKLSHELRSPLAAVAQHARQLGDGIRDATVREGLDAIHDHAVYMLRVIEDVLDAFRAGEPEGTRKPECLSTAEFLEQIVAPAKVCARGKDLALRVTREAGFPDEFWADPVALRRILQNLLDNAVKFTASGEVVLELGLVDAGQVASLQFAVRDTGPGVSDAELARVFEPFEQGQPTLRKAAGLGLGLGLALSRQLAIGLGGELTADSEPGVGSCFRLRIPASVPETAISSEVLEATDADVVAMEPGKRVLLVDDHRLLARVTGRSLRRLGCIVEVAADAGEALALADRSVPDLVILDLDLPDMSGFELCRRLKGREALSSCRFVAYSGSDARTDREAAAAAGFDAFFLKPATAEELLSNVPIRSGTSAGAG